MVKHVSSPSTTVMIQQREVPTGKKALPLVPNKTAQPVQYLAGSVEKDGLAPGISTGVNKRVIYDVAANSSQAGPSKSEVTSLKENMGVVE